MSSRSHTALRSTWPNISSTETSPLPSRLFGGPSEGCLELIKLFFGQDRRLAGWTDEDNLVVIHHHGEEARAVGHISAGNSPLPVPWRIAVRQVWEFAGQSCHRPQLGGTRWKSAADDRDS
jgi:hypothetical protein